MPGKRQREKTQELMIKDSAEFQDYHRFTERLVQASLMTQMALGEHARELRLNRACKLSISKYKPGDELQLLTWCRQFESSMSLIGVPRNEFHVAVLHHVDQSLIPWISSLDTAIAADSAWDEVIKPALMESFSPGPFYEQEAALKNLLLVKQRNRPFAQFFIEFSLAVNRLPQPLNTHKAAVLLYQALDRETQLKIPFGPDARYEEVVHDCRRHATK